MGEALPFRDGSVDAVVCTLTLCSVPDVTRTLAEVCRVLSSAFHPEREAGSVAELKEGLEMLLGHDGMLPASALAESTISPVPHAVVADRTLLKYT